MLQIGGCWRRADGGGGDGEEASPSWSSVSDVPAPLVSRRKPESRV